MSGPLISTLGARVHLFVQPSRRAAFRRLFADVLGCDVAERDFGLEYPILLVTLTAGSFSVEFTDAAPDVVARLRKGAHAPDIVLAARSRA